MTIVLSSHLPGLVHAVCPRVALFNRGRIGLTGKVSDLTSEVLGGAYAVEVEAGASIASGASERRPLSLTTPPPARRLGRYHQS